MPRKELHTKVVQFSQFTVLPDGSSEVVGGRTINGGGRFAGHPSKSFPNSPSRNPNTAPSGGKLLFFNVAWGAMSSKTK